MKKYLFYIILLINFECISQSYIVKCFQDTYTEITQAESNSMLLETLGRKSWSKRFLLDFDFPFYDSTYNYLEGDNSAVYIFDNEPDYGIRLLSFWYEYEVRNVDPLKIKSDVRYKLTNHNNKKAIVIQYTRNTFASDTTIAIYDSYVNFQHWFMEDGSIELRFGKFNINNCPNYVPGRGFQDFVNGDSSVFLGPEVGIQHPYDPNDQMFVSGPYNNYTTGIFDNYLTTIPPEGWVIKWERKPVSNKDITLRDVKIYPNPAISDLNIETDIKIEKMKIIDTFGKIVQIIKSPSKTIDVSNLNEGLFFLELTYDNKTEIVKFIKKE